jgi:hypothetical protein
MAQLPEYASMCVLESTTSPHSETHADVEWATRRLLTAIQMGSIPCSCLQHIPGTELHHTHTTRNDAWNPTDALNPTDDDWR